MAADLGSRLLEAGLVTRAQLARARSAGPPHGGALARELVRLGVEEDAIAGFFLAGGYGPLLDADDLAQADPSAVRRLPAPIADALLALPIRSSPGGLVVAMADPSDRHAVEEIRYAVGQRILPAVARIGELRAAIDRHWPELAADLARGGRDAPEEKARPSRIVSLDEALGGETPIALVRRRPRPDAGWGGSTSGDDRDRAKGSHAPGAAPADDAVPLARPKAWPTPASPRARPGPRTTGRTFPRPGVHPPGDDARGRRSVMRDFERAGMDEYRSVPEPDPPVPARASDEPPPEDRWGDLAETAEAPRARPPKLPPSGTMPARIRRSLEPPRPAPEPSGDVGATLASIRASSTRDEVVRHACEGAATAGRCAVFLGLRRGTLKGLTAVGAGLSVDAVRNLVIPTGSRSLFERVVGEGEPYLGPHGDAPADKLFKAAIGSRGGDVLLAPIVLSGRTAAVLAVDGVSHGQRSRERVELLCQAVAEALKRIIVESKARS